MTSPFIFDVAAVLRSAGMPVQQSATGPSPNRIGLPMMGVAEGEEVSVVATLTPLGDGIMVDADVTAPVTGECVRCLRPFEVEESFHIHEVFAASDDFIQGEDADEEEVSRITNGQLDIAQAVIDAAGLALPFNPTCSEILGEGCSTDVPEPDGIAGEYVGVDPRWAGLEKFT